MAIGSSGCERRSPTAPQRPVATDGFPLRRISLPLNRPETARSVAATVPSVSQESQPGRPQSFVLLHARTPRRRPRREVQEPQTGPESVVAEGQDRVLTLPRTWTPSRPRREINGRPYYDGGLKPYLTEIGRDRLRGTANFLKHADRDPDARLSPPSPGDIDWRIGFCILLYRDLTGGFTLTMMI